MRCTRPLPSPSPVRYSALCLTHRCNLRCTYCYSASEPDRRMSLETAVRAMDFLAEVSHGKCTITFFGGEPLTELSLLKEIVSYGGEAHPGCFQFRMSTNGTLLDPATIKYLEANEIFFVLSLDGDQAQHDTNRRFQGGRGSFRKAIRYLPQVLESNPYTLAVSVVAPNTVSHVARGVKDLFDRGFRYVLQTLDYSAGWEAKHLRTLKAQYRELAEFYSKALKTGRKIYYSPFDERIKTWAQKPYGNGDLCDLANTQIAIAASGRIYPCVQFIGADSEKNGGATIGDIFEGFDDSRRTFFIKENYAEKESCAGCALAGRCATYCGCVNWRATGDLKRIPTITCEHERMLMPIVDGMASALWKQNVELFRRKFYERSYPVSSYVEDCLLEGGAKRC